MDKRLVKQSLSLVMSLLLCITSFNFSLIANAAESDGPRIVSFNELEEGVTNQTLPIGASIEDVKLPNTLKATVETVEEVEVLKAVEKSEEPKEEEKTDAKDEISEETLDDAEEIPAEETSDEADSDKDEAVEEPTEEPTAEPDEAVSEETPEEAETPAEEPTAEPAPTESDEATPEEPADSESVDVSLVDILFPAMIAHAEEVEPEETAESEEPSPVAGASELATPVLTGEAAETAYETVVEKQTVYKSVTIENVEWIVADGKSFDSSVEASYIFTPEINSDYVVATTLPTIKVDIVNKESKPAFTKSQVVDGVRVTVKADAGVFPEGATLSVTKVSEAEEQAVEEAVDEERSSNKNVVESYTFDVKVLDKDGNEIQPDTSKGTVKVSFTLEEVANDNLETDVYHVKGEVGNLTAEELEVNEVSETTVEAATDGFSYYTVEFTYNDLQYVMGGDTTVALSEILATVGLSGNVEAVVSSNPDLFKAENQGGTWQITAMQAFHTNETLTVTLDGVEYEIVVTDDVTTYDIWVGGTQVTSANKTDIPAASGTNTGTASYDPDENTLTLNGYTYEGDCATKISTIHAVVFATGLPSLKVIIRGTVNIKQTDSTNNSISMLYGMYIYCTGTAEIIGEGESPKLIATVGNTPNISGSAAAAIMLSADPGKIKDVSVEARSLATSSWGGSYGIDGAIQYTNSTVEAYGGTNPSGQSAGIKCSGSSSSFVNSTIVAVGSTSNNGSTNSYGIFSNSQSLSNYGTSYFELKGYKAGIDCFLCDYTNNASVKGWTEYDMSDDPVAITIPKTPDEYKVVKITPHSHSFTYTVDGDTITATCSTAGCNLTDQKVTLKIVKPTLTTQGGSGDATATLEGLSDFNAATGLNINAANIQYATAGTTDYSTTAPTTKGTYVAQITAGGETAYVQYTIGNPPAAAPTVDQAREAANISFENEAVSPDGVEISSSNTSNVPVTSLTEILDGSDSPSIYVRYPGDDNHSPSAWVEVSLSPRPAVPTSITTEKASGTSATDGKINGTDTTMEYKADGATSYTTASAGSTSVSPGTYLVRTKATETDFAGKTTSVTIGAKADQQTPDISGISVVKATEGNNDGSISGLTTAMEYSTDGGNTWTAVTGSQLTNLEAGEYQIRYAGDDDKNPSEATVIVIATYIVLDNSTALTINKGTQEVTTPAVGDTLTVECSASGLSYQWLRDNVTITGATSASYTVTADDVGKALSVRVIQAEDSAGALYAGNTKTSEPTSPVTKQEQQSPDITTISIKKATEGHADGSISGLTTDMEYSVDGGNTWTPVTGTSLTNLQAGEYQIRYAENAGKFTSEAESIIIPIFSELNNTTELTINKGTQEVTTPTVGDTLTVACDATDLSYQWLQDGVSIAGATGTSYTVTAADVGKVLSVKVTQKEDINGSAVLGRTKTSEATKPVIKQEQEAPSADGLTPSSTSQGTAEGTISGVTTDMEYSADGGDTWIKVTENPLTGLKPGTYLIRYAATADKAPSEPVVVVVEDSSTEKVEETGTIKVTAEKDSEDVPNTAVYITIKKGNEVIFFENIGTLGNEGLSFEFPEMAIGSYTVICKADDGNFVETQLLNVRSNEKSTASFKILKGEIKTVVEVLGDTPPVAVDGLSSLLTKEEKDKAASTEGYKVEVKLTADEKQESEATGAAEIKEEMGGNQNVDKIFDFSLTKSITSNGKTESEEISEASSVLELAISYDLASGMDLLMYRFHNGVAGILEKLQSRPSELRDGTYFYDAVAKFVHLFSSKFSTYAIVTETKATSSGGGSSSSGSEGVKTVAVYRLFNTVKGYHFYTVDKAERDYLLTEKAAEGWTDEGIAWQASAAKVGKPVYRLFDTSGNSGHLFTSDQSVRDAYIANGWRDEGIAWYAPAAAGREVFKLKGQNGQIFYTTSEAEKNACEAAGCVVEQNDFTAY